MSRSILRTLAICFGLSSAALLLSLGPTHAKPRPLKPGEVRCLCACNFANQSQSLSQVISGAASDCGKLNGNYCRYQRGDGVYFQGTTSGCAAEIGEGGTIRPRETDAAEPSGVAPPKPPARRPVPPTGPTQPPATGPG